MIELRGKNDRWVMINPKDIKCITFDRQTNDRSLFKITVIYYGNEGELEVNGAFTEEECATFKAKFN